MPRMTRFPLRIVGTVVAVAFVWSVIGVSYARAEMTTAEKHMCDHYYRTVTGAAEARDAGVPISAVQNVISSDKNEPSESRLALLKLVSLVYKDKKSTPKQIGDRMLASCKVLWHS